MSYLTTKQKLKQFNDFINQVPDIGEMVVIFDKGEIQDLSGKVVGEFPIALFDKVHAVDFVYATDPESLDNSVNPQS